MTTVVACACCGEKVGPTVHLFSHREIALCYPCLDWLNRQRDNQIKGRGGGWMVRGFEPIFRVTDVPRATDHYAKMGFEIEHHDETYAFAHRDRDLTVHLTLAEGDETPGAGVLYIACEDADQIASEWRKAGLEVVGPEDQDYGKREGSHVDPDGNLIRFGSPLRDVSDDDQPFPELDLWGLVGLAVEDAVARAEAAGVDQLRVLEVANGQIVETIVLEVVRERLDLFHVGGRIEFAVFPTCRHAGEWPGAAE
jgi:catechol 2,3-dioxygenase-like lactoylglutathione lyase family enzyme